MNTDVQLDVVQMIFHLPVASRESILCVNLCFCSSHIALASQLLSNGTCISLNYSTVSFSITYYGISLRQCGRYRRELLHHNAFRALLYLALCICFGRPDYSHLLEIHWRYNCSDVLRVVLMYKYGGTYLDTDIITLQQHPDVSDTPNFVVFEEPGSINGAMLRLRPKHPLLQTIGQQMGT